MRGSALIATLLVCLSAPAAAQGLGGFGIRAGAGLGITFSEQDAEFDTHDGLPVPIAVGPAWQIDIPLAKFEANLLYRRELETAAAVGAQYVEHRLSLPLMLKLNIPGIPVFEAGIGIEPRLLLTADGGTEEAPADILETFVWYAPLSVGGTFDLEAFALNVELRFEFQLSNHYVGLQADEARTHHLMLFVGGFF